MNEKSAAGGSRNAASAAAIAGLAAAAPEGAKVAERAGFPPRRPPDRLSQPSTLFLKKSVRTIRLEVRPPCECPTSQNALTFSLPIWSMTKLTMRSEERRVG